MWPIDKPNLTWKPYWEKPYGSRGKMIAGWFIFLFTPVAVFIALAGCMLIVSVLRVPEPDSPSLILRIAFPIIGGLLAWVFSLFSCLFFQASGIKVVIRKPQMLEVPPYGAGLHFQQYWVRSPLSRRGIVLFGSGILCYRKCRVSRRYYCCYLPWEHIKTIDHFLYETRKLPSECRLDLGWQSDYQPGWLERRRDKALVKSGEMASRALLKRYVKKMDLTKMNLVEMGMADTEEIAKEMVELGLERADLTELDLTNADLSKLGFTNELVARRLLDLMDEDFQAEDFRAEADAAIYTVSQSLTEAGTRSGALPSRAF